MKRFFLFVFAAITAAGVWACPAMPGAFRHVKMVDGTTVKAFIHGDEFFNYETDENEFLLTPNDKGLYVNTRRRISAEEVQQRRAAARRAAGVTDGPRRVVGHPMEPPHILVIMVQYQDTKFQSENTRDAVNDMFNKEGYDYNGSPGSVRDYFIAQSGGKYKPTFDVYGPVTVSKEMAYYGDKNGANPPYTAVKDACKQLDDEIDFSIYDVNGDGDIDFVYMLYAGYGCADSGDENTIWPHHSSERRDYSEKEKETYKIGKYDGKWLTMYACSNELMYNTKGRTIRAGIGAICHETSHHLGLPDYYDTRNTGAINLPRYWSLMGSGNWLNNGITPPNYSIFDKYYMGWETPSMTEPRGHTLLLSPSQKGYVITKNGSYPQPTCTDTVYYIENRQNKGWDEYLPGHGLVIWRVVYDQKAWDENRPNSVEKGELCRVSLLSASGISTNIGIPPDSERDSYPGTTGKTYQKLFSNHLVSGITEREDGMVAFDIDNPILWLVTKEKQTGTGFLQDALNEEIHSYALDSTVYMRWFIPGTSSISYRRYENRYINGEWKGWTLSFIPRTTSTDKMMKGFYANGSTTLKKDRYHNCDSVAFRIEVTLGPHTYWSNTLKVELEHPKYPLYYNYFGEKEFGGRYKAGEQIYYPINDCEKHTVESDIPTDCYRQGREIVFAMPPCSCTLNIIDNPKLTVRFFGRQGQLLKTEEVKCGESAHAPDPPKEDGLFLWWSDDFSEVTEDMDIYAKYSRYNWASDTPSGISTVCTVANTPTYPLPPSGTSGGWSAVTTGWTAVTPEGEGGGYPEENPEDNISPGAIIPTIGKVKVGMFVSDILNVKIKTQYLESKEQKIHLAFTDQFDNKGKPVYETDEAGNLQVNEKLWEEVASMPAEEAQGEAEMTASLSECYDENCESMPSGLRRKAFKVVAQDEDGNLVTADEEVTIDYFYPMYVRLRKSDRMNLLLTASGCALSLPDSAKEAGDYLYAMIPVQADGRCIINALDMEDAGCLNIRRLGHPSEPLNSYHSGNKIVMRGFGMADTLAIEKTVYSVTFNWLDRQGVQRTETQQVPCGNEATPPEDHAADRIFTGWAPGEADLGRITHDLTLTAQYESLPEPVYYTVVFTDLDGTEISSQQVLEYEAADEPEIPEHEGYTFIRWSGSFSAVSSDMTVRAIYGQDDKEWIVTFLNWDDTLLGKDTVPDGQRAYGSVYPYRTGYRFTGWDKPLDEIRSDLTTHALFEEADGQQYKVSIVIEGQGTVETRPLGVDLDHVNAGSVLFLTAVPDEGWKFAGWENYSVQFGLTVSQDTTVKASFSATSADVLIHLASAAEGDLTTADELQRLSLIEYDFDPSGNNYVEAYGGQITGTLEEGSQLSFSVTPYIYEFDHWSDGTGGADRVFDVTSGIELTIYLRPRPLSVKAVCDGSQGTVSTEGGGPLLYNERNQWSATLTATPANGMAFAGWVPEMDWATVDITPELILEGYTNLLAEGAEYGVSPDELAFVKRLFGSVLSLNGGEFDLFRNYFGFDENGSFILRAAFRKSSSTGLSDKESDGRPGAQTSSPQKLLRNGILYILRGNRIYTLQGQEVK